MTEACVHNIRIIEHHDVVMSGIIVDEFSDKHPHGWKNQLWITLEEATEAYLDDIIAESHY
jgi:hypothetical protein